MDSVAFEKSGLPGSLNPLCGVQRPVPLEWPISVLFPVGVEEDSYVFLWLSN